MKKQSAVMRPLRRAAGERKGAVAKQRVGEVVFLTGKNFPGASTAPTSPSPRYARVPSLSPHSVGGEGL
jgi:hypothetical protein